MLRPSSIFYEVIGRNINVTVYGTLKTEATYPIQCVIVYLGPLAAGTYDVNFIQSVGPVDAPVVSVVATAPLMISDAGRPIFATVLPKYPLPEQPISIRIRANTPSSPAMAFPHKTTVDGNVVRIEGCYSQSGFSVPGVYIATVGVPPVPAGRYRVEYHRTECDELGRYIGTPRLIASFDFDVKPASPDWPGASDEVMPVAEYYHQNFGHYFITADEREQIALDSGTFSGWTFVETYPNKFGLWRAAEGLVPVCRFFSTAFAPKSSHFYTADADECEKVKANSDWLYEGIVGYVLPSGANNQCQQGKPLHRLYNGGRGGAPSHKYTIDAYDKQSLVQNGWIDEGVLGCVPTIAPPFSP